MKKNHYRTHYSPVHPHWSLLQHWQHFFRCTKALFFIPVHHATVPSIPQLIRRGPSYRSIFGQVPLQLGSPLPPMNSPLPFHTLPYRGP